MLNSIKTFAFNIPSSTSGLATRQSNILLTVVIATFPFFKGLIIVRINNEINGKKLRKLPTSHSTNKNFRLSSRIKFFPFFSKVLHIFEAIAA